MIDCYPLLVIKLNFRLSKNYINYSLFIKLRHLMYVHPSETEPVKFGPIFALSRSSLISSVTRSTQTAQTSLAEADNYSHIATCKNVEYWW